MLLTVRCPDCGSVNFRCSVNRCSDAVPVQVPPQPFSLRLILDSDDPNYYGVTLVQNGITRFMEFRTTGGTSERAKSAVKTAMEMIPFGVAFRLSANEPARDLARQIETDLNLSVKFDIGAE